MYLPALILFRCPTIRVRSAAPTITANSVIERKFVAILYKARGGRRKIAEYIRYGAIVRGNLIEIMHNACALNIPDSWAALTRNLLLARPAFRRDRIKFRERNAVDLFRANSAFGRVGRDAFP